MFTVSLSPGSNQKQIDRVCMIIHLHPQITDKKNISSVNDRHTDAQTDGTNLYPQPLIWKGKIYKSVLMNGQAAKEMSNTQVVLSVCAEVFWGYSLH